MMLKTYTIHDLPPEILVIILKNLDYNQLLRVRLVCSRFWNVLNNFPTIWGLSQNCSVQNYLRGSAIIKKIDRDLPVLDVNDFQLLADQLENIPITTPLRNRFDLNFFLQKAKEDFIYHNSWQKFSNKKHIIINILRFSLFVLLLALSLSCYNKTYVSDFIVGLTGGLITGFTDWYLLSSRLSADYYSHYLSATYQRQKQSCFSAAKKYSLKLLDYRDVISFILAIALLVNLIMNDCFSVTEHCSFKNLLSTFKEYFDNCYKKTEGRHYFFTSEINPRVYYMGDLLGYSLLSVCIRSLQYAMKKFDKESNYQLPVYHI